MGVIVLGALVFLAIRAESSAAPVADPTVTVTAKTTVTATVTVTPSPPTPPAGEPCATSRLRSALVPNLLPGRSGLTSDFEVILTNTGTVSCTISGYPTVVFVGYKDGTQLGLPAEKTGLPKATGGSTTLGPGESQAVELTVDEGEAYAPESGCDVQSADGVRITPPGQSASLYSPAGGLAACASDKVSILSVGAFGDE